MDITRRLFLRVLTIVAGAAVTLPAMVARAKKLAIKLTQAEALTKVGGAATLKIKDETILFVRDSETTVVAVDPTCTHQQCAVSYSPDKKTFDCQCHGSSFTLEGKVLGGPAPAPLKTYPAALSGDRIILTMGD